MTYKKKVVIPWELEIVGIFGLLMSRFSKSKVYAFLLFSALTFFGMRTNQ